MSLVSYLRTVVLGSGLILTGVVHADDANVAEDVAQLATMDLEQLLGVVVVASGTDESLFQAPAAVTVLTRDDIRARAATTVPDLLRTVPGVQVVRVGPGNYVVSLRGTGGVHGNNVIVVLDGVPINSPLDGNVDWQNFPADVASIERLEVARGPVSPIFGANAYTGVIRIETVAGEQGKPAFEVGVRGGVDHVPAPGGGVYGHVRGGDAAVQYALRAHGVDDDTWSQGERGEQEKWTAGALGGRVDMSLSEHARASVDFGTSVSRASATDALVLEPGAHRTHLTYGRGAFSLVNLAPALSSITLWSHVRAVQRFSDQRDFAAFHYDDTHSLQNTTGLDVDLALPGEFRLSVGSELSVIRADAPFIHPEENDTLRLGTSVRANASVDLIEHVILAAAGRLDVSSFVDELPTSFRASATYYQSNLSLRATAGSAFRNPTYVEAGSRFIDRNNGTILLEGEDDLNAPRLEAVELAGTFAAFDALTLQLTGYLARAKDLVEGDFEQLVRRTYRNSEEDTSLVGTEAELGYRPRDDVNVELSGSYIHFLEENEDAAATLGAARHNSRFIGALTGRWTPLGGRALLGAAMILTTGREYRIAAGIPPPVLPPVEVPVNARIELACGYDPWKDVPLNVRLAVVTHAPHGFRESPLPSAAELGTLALGSVVYRTR